MAPEKLLGDGDTKVTDYWSLGCLIYEMLVGEPPFFDAVAGNIYRKILNDKLRIPKDIEGPARSLLKGLLVKERDSRLGSRGIEEIMNHPFFEGTDWKMIENLRVKAPFEPKLFQFENNEKGKGPDEVVKAKQTHSYRRIFKSKNLGGCRFVGKF